MLVGAQDITGGRNFRKLSYAPTNKFLPTVENLTVKKKFHNIKNKFGLYSK